MHKHPRRGVGSNQYQNKPSAGGSIEPPAFKVPSYVAVDVANYGVPSNTVAARDSLLKILTALDVNRDALVVVGAQAIYERTKDLPHIAPTSTHDSDLVLDPMLLATTPLLSDTLAQAGFRSVSINRPGVWSEGTMGPDLVRTAPTVDLIVPAVVGGAGRRGARLGVHGKSIAMKTNGVEMTLLDKSLIDLKPLNNKEQESIRINVAGSAALLCAKAWKLYERVQDSGHPGRVNPKDAADMWRIMACSDPRQIRATFDTHGQHVLFGPNINLGCDYLIKLFSPPTGMGTPLAVDSLIGTHYASKIKQDIDQWIGDFAGA